MAHSEDVQGWGVTIVNSVGNDGFSPEREGRELGGRCCGGGLEGMRNGGELSTKAERDPTRRSAWVQGGEGCGDSDLAGEFDAAVGWDIT